MQMSTSVDANILLYASDESNPVCRQAKDLVRQIIESREVFCLAWPTVMAYIRIATHPRIFADPLSHSEAVANVDTLVNQPHIRMLGEEEGFWESYKEAALEVPTSGNLVPDTQLATILRQHGVKALYTRDKDFRRYPWLKTMDPFKG
jgi:hypothetical protein